MQQIKAKEKEKTIFQKIKRKIKKERPFYQINTEPFFNKYHDTLKVVLHPNALMKAIVYYATTQKLQGNMEVMGWLVGRRKGDILEILDTYIGDCKSSSAYTQLDVRETIKMKKMAKKENMELMGQWHCHPSFGTSPSHVDLDAMSNLSKFGMKTPVMLIVNNDDFWIGTIKGKYMRKLHFIIPRKIDTKLNLNLGYINGEYQQEYYNWQSPYPQIQDETVKEGEEKGWVNWILDVIERPFYFIESIFKKMDKLGYKQFGYKQPKEIKDGR